MLRPLSRLAAGVSAAALLAGCAVRFFPAGDARPFEVDCGARFRDSYTGQKVDRFLVVTVDNAGACPIEARTVVEGTDAELLRVDAGARAVAVTDAPRAGRTLDVVLHCGGDAESGKCRGALRIAAARRAGGGGLATLTVFELARATLSENSCDGTRELGSFGNRLRGAGVLWLEVSNRGTCNLFQVDVTIDGETVAVADAEGGRPTVGDVAIAAGRTARLVARCAASDEAGASCAGAVKVELRQ